MMNKKHGYIKEELVLVMIGDGRVNLNQIYQFLKVKYFQYLKSKVNKKQYK